MSRGLSTVKRILLILAKIALATGLILWLLHSGKLDLSELSGISERWPWLLMAFSVFGGVLLMASLRWRLLLKAQGINYSLHPWTPKTPPGTPIPAPG